MLSREVELKVNYNGIHATKDLKKLINNASFTENSAFANDVFSINLDNSDKRWFDGWMPKINDVLSFNFNLRNDIKEGSIKAQFAGSFFVDDYGFDGGKSSGRSVDISAISSSPNTQFQKTKNTRTFDDATIFEIVRTIAENNNLFVAIDTFFNYTITSIRQDKQTDASFLTKLLKKYGYSMKVYNTSLIIYREKEYESRSSGPSIDESDMSSYSFAVKSVYGGIKNEFKDPISDELNSFVVYGDLSESFVDLDEFVGDVSNPNIAIENIEVNSDQENEIVCKAKLRELNRLGTVISFSIPGRPNIYGSTNIGITGFGKLNGKYFIDSVTHGFTSSGYSTKVKAHKVLEGDY